MSKLGILLLARGTFGVRIFDEWVHLPENPQSMPELKFWGNCDAGLKFNIIPSGSPPPPQEDVWENCSNGRIMYEQIALTVSREWKKHRYITPLHAFQPPYIPTTPYHTYVIAQTSFLLFSKTTVLIAESFLSFVVKLNLLPLWMNCIPFSHVWKEIYGYSLLHFLGQIKIFWGPWSEKLFLLLQVSQP